MAKPKTYDNWVEGQPRIEIAKGGTLLRLSEILAPSGPIPVSKSTWYLGMKSGRFPAPVRLGMRIVAWRSQDIENLVNGGFF